MRVFSGKNYLGHDKRWADNLIVFPDHWAGDPCVQIWGGHVTDQLDESKCG